MGHYCTPINTYSFKMTNLVQLHAVASTGRGGSVRSCSGDKIGRVWGENFRLFGVRKVWMQLSRRSYGVARFTVAQLIRPLGLRAAARGPMRSPVLCGGVDCEVEHVPACSGDVGDVMHMRDGRG